MESENYNIVPNINHVTGAPNSYSIINGFGRRIYTGSLQGCEKRISSVGGEKSNVINETDPKNDKINEGGKKTYKIFISDRKKIDKDGVPFEEWDVVNCDDGSIIFSGSYMHCLRRKEFIEASDKINSTMNHTGTAKRFNQGKLRYDLLPPIAIEQLVKVLTIGAEKYGDNNWKGGMSWMSIIASMKRHIAAFEMCQDVDIESGLYHMAHVMCNAAFLIEYYKMFPEGDDRDKRYLKTE